MTGTLPRIPPLENRWKSCPLVAHKILIVEDTPETCDILTILLELKGYDVVVAKDGVMGLEQIQVHEPDLIITDIQMPSHGRKSYDRKGPRIARLPGSADSGDNRPRKGPSCGGGQSWGKLRLVPSY